MPPKQETRKIGIETALGDDILSLRSVVIQEELSRPFQIDAELSSEDGQIVFDDVIGHAATIRMDVGKNEVRYFHGFVSRFIQVANVGGYAHYRATIVPWIWLLTRTSDCRIFQEKSVPEIIEEILQGHGFSDYKLRLTGNYAKKEYCVQYRETDFNFFSRLLEQEGIYYFFEHEQGKHNLILADSISAHSPFPGFEEVPFQELEKGASGREAITDWIAEKELQPVAYALNDYDFKKPKASLYSSANLTRNHGNASFEFYDYPGEYVEHGEGDRLAQVRLDELQSHHEVFQAQATARGMAAGSIFKLKDHPRKDQNREYLITSVLLQANAGEFASGGENGEFFSCEFTAIESGQQYRSVRSSPKPVIQGPQTAVVVGPKGEEIHTDDYGRVKVQFHWDRYGKKDENSSCWVRVSQAWAGKNWGAIFLPRMGQEVIIDFLEGDPDLPIITGRVYNADTKTPYELPANKTMSTIKSLSSKGGEGFNEIRFEDKKGEEQIFIHGEKNLDMRIKNDSYEWVGNNRHVIVKTNKSEHIENNRNEIVDADHKEKIGKDRHLKIVGKEAKAVDGSLSLTVKGDVMNVFKANHSEQTTNDYFLKADNIVIEAMSNVTIKVGQSYIAIDSSGIKISATQVEVEGMAKADVKSPTTSVKGDAMLVLQGGIVKIN